jgi:transcriptional regulator with XRE-family HTH domain
MAGRLGLAVSTYSNYENGHREPPFVVIERISKVLEISPFSLLDFPRIPGTLTAGSEIAIKAMQLKIDTALLDTMAQLGYALDYNAVSENIKIVYPDGYKLPITREILDHIAEKHAEYLIMVLTQLRFGEEITTLSNERTNG